MQISGISSYTKWYVPPSPSQASRMTPSSYQTQLMYGLANQLTLNALQSSSVRNQDYRQQLVDFSSKSNQLAAAAKPFQGTTSLLSARSVQSDSTAITGVAKNGATQATYDVKVNQVAQGQKNSSMNLSSSALGGLAAGDYRLGLTVAGQEKQVSFSVSATDNNKTILGKIASAVNTAYSGKTEGINAEVKTAGSFSYLSLANKATGQNAKFSVRDVSGNAVSALKLDSTVQTAQDSSYEINGKAYTSKSNQVSLDNGQVTLNLQSATTSVAKVQVNSDVKGQVAAVKDLISAYNASRSQLAGADNLTGKGNHVFDGVEKVLSDQRYSLSDIGISVDRKSGQISLNEEQLTDSLTNNPKSVQRLFTGSGGLATKIGQAAKTMTVQPASNFLATPNLAANYNFSSLYGLMGNYAQSYAAPGIFMDQRV